MGPEKGEVIDEAHLEYTFKRLSRESLRLDAERSVDLRGKSRRSIEHLALLLPFCSGFSLPVVSGIIRQLSETLGNSLWAVGIDYFLCAAGAITLASLTAHEPPSHKEAFQRLGVYIQDQPTHVIILAGGLLGALQNVLGSYAIFYIGPEVMSATALIGQLLFSILFDTTGIFWTTSVPVRASSIVGVIIAALGCALYQMTAYKDLFVSQRPNSLTVCLVLLALLAGGVTCVQSGIGRKLRTEVGRFRRAAAINYSVGCLCAVCLAACLDTRPRFLDLRWRHLTGLIVPLVNVFNLTSLCLSPMWMSMSTCMTCWACGNLMSASLLASTGWLRSRQSSSLGWRMWLGMAFVLLGLLVKNETVRMRNCRQANCTRSENNNALANPEVCRQHNPSRPDRMTLDRLPHFKNPLLVRSPFKSPLLVRPPSLFFNS